MTLMVIAKFYFDQAIIAGEHVIGEMGVASFYIDLLSWVFPP